jgi:hypothetical protein
VAYADFRPTDSQIAVQAQLSGEIARDRERLDGAFLRDIESLNALLRDKRLPTIGMPSK